MGKELSAYSCGGSRGFGGSDRRTPFPFHPSPPKGGTGNHPKQRKPRSPRGQALSAAPFILAKILNCEVGHGLHPWFGQPAKGGPTPCQARLISSRYQVI